jgi:hypothetical protein
VREGAAWIKGERSEDGVDLVEEVIVEALFGCGVEVLDIDELDAFLSKRGDEGIVEAVARVDHQLRDDGADGFELGCGGEAVGADFFETCVDLMLEAGDADHEEFV